MTRDRILALAECIDAFRRVQEADGFKSFVILTEDGVSMNEAKIIADALRAYEPPLKTSK